MQIRITRIEEFPKEKEGFKEIILTFLKQIIGNMIAFFLSF